MTALLAVLATGTLAFGTLTFVEQEIPRVHVGHAFALSDRPYGGGYFQTDFDGDDHVDLLFDDAVQFQRDGGFPQSARKPLPKHESLPWGDAMDGALYLCFNERLLILRWRNDAWQTEWEQPADWPARLRDWRGRTDTSACMAMERFLHDLNRDGSPEIVFVDQGAVHIYVRGQEGYRRALQADIAPEFAQERPKTLPPGRGIASVIERRTCTSWFDGPEFWRVSCENLAAQGYRYRTAHQRLEFNEGTIAFSDVEDQVTEPLPSRATWHSPCRMNDDTTIDFGGYERHAAGGTHFGLPVTMKDTWITTDGGKTVQRFRGMYRAQFADFDGDDDLDLLQQSTGLFEGGMRECISRALSHRKAHHELAVHLQDAAGRFSETPFLRFPFEIQLDAVPVRLTRMFRSYCDGELVNVAGDFNGDGRCDLLVQDRPERLAVYLNTGKGFTRQPVATASCPGVVDFGVADVNGDGLSDIKTRRLLDGDEETRNVVFFAKETRP